MVCNIWRLLRGCLETWRKHLYIFIFRNDFPGWVEGRQEGLCLVSTFLRSYCERIFWSLACTCAFVIGTYLIYRVIDKSITSPVLVSFDGWVWLWVEWSFNLIFFRTPVPIWEIPFPALTLCNMNKVTYTAQVHNLKKRCSFFQVRRSKVNEIVEALKKDPTNLYLLQEEFFIDEVGDKFFWFVHRSF